MESIENRMLKVKKEIDEISPHFCVAKWLQVTLHLQLGQNHSCHHPKIHEISKDCINNPKLLHNTQYKKNMWKDIMMGKKIDECAYCNDMEDEGVIFSDRIIKSTDAWARHYIKKILEDPFADINPTYVEVNFSHVCNCQCSYCAPWISSEWEKDIIENGYYPTSQKFGMLDSNRTPIKGKNIYKEAFWKWWPELVKSLHHFRITGGEPLLHNDTFKIMDDLLENPRPELEFSVNTNMCVNEKLMNKFLFKCEQLIENKCVKRMWVYSSCEAYGKAAEYSRWGLNYNYWWKFVDKVLEIKNINFVIMATYNIFSVTTFLDFLIDVNKRKQTHGRKINLDVPFLRNPQFLCANILPSTFLNYTKECVEYIKNNQEDYVDKLGFMHSEYDKFKRVYKMMETSMENDYSFLRNDFFNFVNEWDKRKNLNFLDIFPDMKSFYYECQLK